MALFVELPHGYAFDLEQVLWYQINSYGDGYNPDVEYGRRKVGGVEWSMHPVDLRVHFKNGSDLEILGFESYFIGERLYPKIKELESQSANSALPTPICFDITSNNGVYFVQGEITRRIKIGYSESVDKRMKALETSEPLRLLHVIPNAGTDVESGLHKKFSHLRVIGEWFEGEQEILDYLRSL